MYVYYIYYLYGSKLIWKRRTIMMNATILACLEYYYAMIILWTSFMRLQYYCLQYSIKIKQWRQVESEILCKCNPQEQPTT